MTAEHARLAEIRDDVGSWRRWGPYVGDRAWGTVREDYSENGDAWSFLTHDLARSKAFRWGEDGIAGICDRYHLLCLAPAFWNGRDPILKERLFGLTPHEANHGEDVKELYFHLDNLPSHAYMSFLYKYPQAEFPYLRLLAENRRRGKPDREFELIDTGVFDDDRYFDIVIEYAKASPDALGVRIEAFNRGPESAPLHILAQLWYRNTWGWDGLERPTPRITLEPAPSGVGARLRASDCGLPTPRRVPVNYRLGPYVLDGQAGCEALFTDNETNAPRVFGPGFSNRSPYVKDAFHERIVQGRVAATRPEPFGTKAALWYRFDAVPPGGSVVVRLRLAPETEAEPPLEGIDSLIGIRRGEADAFYESIAPACASPDERLIQRRAFAGLLWTKRSYLFDVSEWLNGDDPCWPPPAGRSTIRNTHWRHLNSMRILSLPDAWEYPWFATWDLAFHCVPLALIDPAFAKDQLWTLLFEQFQHPNGQLPAYEWEFSDTNPPVHAWAVWRVYNMDRIRSGQADRDFLERCFHKLLINFAWWVNKVDREGNNIFEGGFLGLDNITVFDRSVRCAEGSILEQSDATGWMGMFCLNLMRIALELAKENPVYEALATKFFQHYVYVAAAMKHMGGRDYALWDDEDGFFYDVLRRPDGSFHRFRVRSLVGLVPLFAVERLERSWIEPFSSFRRHLDWFLTHRADLTRGVVHTVDHESETTHVLTIVDFAQLTRILERVFDPAEFLSPFGVRSLSRVHASQPFSYEGMTVGYEPGESLNWIKGGNSNWRGPIWFPTCFLLIESLRKLAKAYGADAGIRSPAHGHRRLTFGELANELAERLIAIFRRDPETGRRPMDGGQTRYATDPHWQDLLLFYEYFHGETGEGLGASHQTGWTALVASLIDEWRQSPTRSGPPAAALARTPQEGNTPSAANPRGVS
ncbi:MAG: glucosidase [Isosphaeraceae bacterium]|nr:MAG: glucosidase [Isosphaeraceae bacterium]